MPISASGKNSFSSAAVGDADLRVREKLLQFGGGLLDVLHPVVQIVYLPAAPKLFIDGLGDQPHIVLDHVRLHRVAVQRGLFDHRKVAYTHHGEIQRARDRRR